MQASRGAAIVLAVLASMSAQAFEVDGYTSGMSVTDLENAVVRSGSRFVARDGTAATYAAIRVGAKDPPVDVVATFSLCAGKLVYYGHSLDFDAAFASTLERLLQSNGQPTKVYVTRQPWSGQNGGYIVSTYMSWYQGQNRIELSFVPEGRTSKGELRHSRAASISYAAKNTCWLEKNW